MFDWPSGRAQGRACPSSADTRLLRRNGVQPSGLPAWIVRVLQASQSSYADYDASSRVSSRSRSAGLSSRAEVLMLRLCLFALPLLALLACGGENNIDRRVEPKAEPPAISHEDRELLDKIKAREKAKAELSAMPSRFLRGGRWESFDKGIFNSYTRATSAEFTNASEFDVSELSGKLTYMDENGAELATVPFSAKGEVRAGQTTKLELTAGEITGSARKATFTVERVRILGG